MRIIVFGFGRMNPPTIGHRRLAKQIAERVRKERTMNTGSEVRGYLFLSSKENQIGSEKKDNPLKAQEKLFWAQKILKTPDCTIELSDQSSGMHVAEYYVKNNKADKIVYVHGSDPGQIKFAENIVKQVNSMGKIGDSQKIVRGSGSISESAISATFVRNLVRDAKLTEFKKAYPSLSSVEAEKLFFLLRGRL